MSTSVLKALPGKLDIKRLSPSILYFLPPRPCHMSSNIFVLWVADEPITLKSPMTDNYIPNNAVKSIFLLSFTSTFVFRAASSLGLLRPWQLTETV